jgi:hypothetical protein
LITKFTPQIPNLPSSINITTVSVLHTDNNQLKAAAEETTTGAMTMAAATATARTSTKSGIEETVMAVMAGAQTTINFKWHWQWRQQW